jgi:predicted P-loop ATPase
MKKDNLPSKKNTNIIKPIEWKNFKKHKKNYGVYRKYLGKNIVILNHTTTAFLLDENGSINFEKQINFDDLKLDLKDHGFKITDSDYASILNSDKIQRIDSLKIFFNHIESNKWDGKDRIEDLIKAAKLSGDFNTNFHLIKKWFCTTYGFAMRGIDPMTPKTVHSRVVFILYSEQRGFGKTEFFRKIGLMGAIEDSTGLVGTEIYAETTGELPKDERNFEINLTSKMIYLFDDINNLLIKGEGKLRSIISSQEVSKRTLYKDTNENLKRRSTFAGTTNYNELLRNDKENRYMVFTVTEKMDFELLNSIDIMQLWCQIRQEVIKHKDKAFFSSKDLDIIRNLSKNYIYNNPLEETLKNMLVFDPDGKYSFSEITKNLRDNGIYEPIAKVGRVLKTLAPEGQDIKTKSSDGTRYYKLKWRYDYGTHGMPF